MTLVGGRYGRQRLFGICVLGARCATLGCFLPPLGHQGLVTVHTEDALRGARITQVLDLALTIAALETACAEGLIASQDSQILDLVAAAATTVSAVVANQRAVAQEK